MDLAVDLLLFVFNSALSLFLPGNLLFKLSVLLFLLHGEVVAALTCRIRLLLNGELLLGELSELFLRLAQVSKLRVKVALVLSELGGGAL